MPLRCAIHSSEVSITCARSSLVTQRAGTWKPVAMNSVRRIDPRGGWYLVAGRERLGKISPPAEQSKGAMELTVTAAQLETVRGAKHLPEALQRVLAAARASGGGDLLTLSYEEATALNELCSWNVHSDAAGAVTPASRPFDELVRAIMTHPEY